jgi:hypothetical protein
MRDVAFAGPGTPLPGFVAVGTAFVEQPGGPGYHTAAVWRSGDGAVWDLVPSTLFGSAARDAAAWQVAATRKVILMMGGADVVEGPQDPTGENPKQRGVAFWRILDAADGWLFSTDQPAEGRSSQVAALTSTSNTFVTAVLVRDTESREDSAILTLISPDGRETVEGPDVDLANVAAIAAGEEATVWVGLGADEESGAAITTDALS